ncbi:MAG TPA: SDR family NAD(P)-dependent oxidoreductase [Actinomycetota bacterium]
MEWKGSTAFITGASRGIGAAVARAAAAEGARVGLIARSKADLDDVLAACGGAGAIAVADVGERAQAEEAVAALTRELGPPDLLVNNAGLGAYGRFDETDPDIAARLVRVNYLGALYATAAALPSMIERRRGHIVNVASIAGRVPAPFESVYSGSKFALAGWSDALDIELAPKGITVTLVNPGPVETDFFAARGAPYERSSPKPVTAEAVAAAIVAAVRKGRHEVYIPRWLRFPAAMKGVLPGSVRKGTARNFRRDLA